MHEFEMHTEICPSEFELNVSLVADYESCYWKMKLTKFYYYINLLDKI